MRHSDRRPAGLLVTLALFASTACSQPFAKHEAPKAKPLALDQLAIVAPDVAVVSAKPSTQVALKRQLLAAVESALGSRGHRIASPSEDDANRIVRLNVAHAKSPLHIYREFIGVQQKPRRHLAPAEVRGLAEGHRADAVIVTRLEGVEVSTSQRLTEAATGFVGSAAIGVITMSPMRLLGAAARAAETPRGTHLRVTVVDGASGEVLWANWAVEKSSPSAETVSELVARAFSTFPRLVDRTQAVASLEHGKDAPAAALPARASTTSAPAGTSPPRV
ncbi:MAG: hypothetical protein ACREQJ_18875 [Candidatus Binatia bacterium]